MNNYNMDLMMISSILTNLQVNFSMNQIIIILKWNKLKLIISSRFHCLTKKKNKIRSTKIHYKLNNHRGSIYYKIMIMM